MIHIMSVKSLWEFTLKDNRYNIYSIINVTFKTITFGRFKMSYFWPCLKKLSTEGPEAFLQEASNGIRWPSKKGPSLGLRGYILAFM